MAETYSTPGPQGKEPTRKASDASETSETYTSRPESKNTSTGINEKLFASNIPEPFTPRQGSTFIVTMPFPGTAGAPYFDGSNVSEFLDVYDDMCTDYKVSSLKKLKQLPQYCESLTGGYIRTLAEYVEKDYDGLRKVLKVEYKGEDQVQQMHTKAFLETLKDKPRSNDEDVGPFCRQYAAISRVLMKKGKLDTYTQKQWFVQGLPTPIQNELCYCVELSKKKEMLMSFNDMLEDVLFMVKARRNMSNMLRPAGSADKISELVDKSMLKSKGGFSQDRVRNFKPKVLFASTSEPSSILSRIMDKPLMSSRLDSISELTQKMDQLTLAMKINAEQLPTN